jgi:hypothetical protein
LPVKNLNLTKQPHISLTFENGTKEPRKVTRRASVDVSFASDSVKQVPLKGKIKKETDGPVVSFEKARVASNASNEKNVSPNCNNSKLSVKDPKFSIMCDLTHHAPSCFIKRGSFASVRQVQNRLK